jgi:UDP-2,4-diacetamido-2,4,6-trideoxy-beta-L-altropyranose hydrolase
MPLKLLIRSDASIAIGTGHIMRMIALGQGWIARGGEVCFVCAQITPALRERLDQEGFALHVIDAQPASARDLGTTCGLIRQSREKDLVVVLDGYHFDSNFQLGVKNAGSHLLVMDDYGHTDFYHADWVLNQNISAREELYPNRAPDTQLLLGPKFALLRKEFLKYRGKKREISEVARKFLVSLGGSDPDNVTRRVMEAMEHLDVEVKVVVGGSNPHLQSLCHVVENLKSSTARFELIVNSANMPELMAWADMAVAAGGSTSLELAFLGLPALYFVLAENQLDIALSIEKNGVGFCVHGRSETFQMFGNTLRQVASERSLRSKISTTAASMVDGSGVVRVIKTLDKVAK